MRKNINDSVHSGFPKIQNTKSKISVIVYTSDKARKLMDWLYEDATIFLKRKKERYDSMKQNPRLQLSTIRDIKNGSQTQLLGIEFIGRT